MNPKNEKLAASIALMSAQAVKLEAAAAARTNALGDVCGAVPGRRRRRRHAGVRADVGGGLRRRRRQRAAADAVAELCAEAAFFAVQGGLELGRQSYVASFSRTTSHTQ